MSQMSHKNLDSFFNAISKRNGNLKDVRNKISGDGDLMELTNEKAVIYNIMNVLSIPRGSYPFDPEFGCDLNRYIFDLGTIQTKMMIENEIDKAMAPYANIYKLSKSVKYTPDKKSFIIKIMIETSLGEVIEKKLTVGQNGMFMGRPEEVYE